jgi:hypothetical protein
MAAAVTSPEWLTRLETASPQALGLAMLQADPHARHLDHAARQAAVSDALDNGAVTAQELRAQCKSGDPREIARQLGLTIEVSDEDPLVTSLWRFAEYSPRPPGIKVYRRALDALDHALDRSLAMRLLGAATPKDVFIAHELYHHAEATRTDEPMARRHQVTLFRIGKWRWRSGIASLSEIAAGAFAQGLLDLPYHPRMLDLVVLARIRSNLSPAPASSTPRATSSAG